MPDHPEPLSPAATLVRLASIGVVVAVAAGAFAYAGGWLTPGTLTQGRIIDEFQTANGVHPGFRRNHAKGVCIAGSFAANGNAARLSKAGLFAAGTTTPVDGRFALAVGQPYAPDSDQTVRSMALRFRLADGEEWRTGINDIPAFPVATPEGFYDLLTASAPDPATGKPDPAKMQAFAAKHPEAPKAFDLIKARQVTTGFADDSYNSLNAFRFVDTAGTATPVRWAMVAADPAATAAPAPAASPDKTYLFEALAQVIAKAPAQWRLMVTVGKPGDNTADATLPWGPDHEQIDAGMLTIDRVAAEADGNCRDVNFDPLVLPAGIASSDDPLLSARSAAYSVSFTRREGEAKTPSAVANASATSPGAASPGAAQ